MRPTIIFFFLIAVLCSCENYKKSNTLENNELIRENECLKEMLSHKDSMGVNQMATYLTFQNNKAEDAMNFYVALFENSKIINTTRWAKDGFGEEGKIMHATFSLNGNTFMCSDSPPIHDWDFSPAVSNYIECKSKKELDRFYSKLSENGSITMPLKNYGFSQEFGWVIDQFGVSWQLNLE